MFRPVPAVLGLFSLSVILALYYASLYVVENLSPQGCRMSYMSPSYILQSSFNLSWTPLADRYSLWLYREVGWDPNQIHGGAPMLFIPGNAGSSRQARSIASSAARQYYKSPNNVNEDVVREGVKPLDIFTLEFNEDLTAFHGPTMESQIRYTSHAIDYILSHYSPNTSIIIMGHSMGGIVAVSLLPRHDIAAIITMSTPHTIPPARFDHRIDQIYDRNSEILRTDPTPILSLCGGATDMMIPSESCVLGNTEGGPFRSTVFSSALEGAWTGVGHREMVWCHQVRWRVARAALQLSAAASVKERGTALDTWIRDGHELRQEAVPYGGSKILDDPATFEVLPDGRQLILRKPNLARTYLLPVPQNSSTRAVLYVSRGIIPPVSPQKSISLQASMYLCDSADIGSICRGVKPAVHRLIPNPTYDKSFPVPREGTDESEGVVLFEADIPATQDPQWVAISVDRASGDGWIVGGLEMVVTVVNDVSMFSLLSGDIQVKMPSADALRTVFSFPGLVSHALLVYHVTPRLESERHCSDPDPLLPPLIMHASHRSETHYFPLTSSHRRILLHTHATGPYVTGEFHPSGVAFTVYSSGATGCGSDVNLFLLGIDWRGTMGRWATRYFTTVVSWAIGVVSILLYESWTASEKEGGSVPSVDQALARFCYRTLPKILPLSMLCALLPLPRTYFVGNGGQPFLSVLAPLLLLVSTGLVTVSTRALALFMWPLGRIGQALFGRPREEVRSVRRSTIISMVFIFVLIFLFIPWQVAFLGCWLIQLYTCSFPVVHESSESAGVSIPLLQRNEEHRPSIDAEQYERRAVVHLRSETTSVKLDNFNHNRHILLLMTWLLPLAAPVLVVWVRTLMTAGLTTPFDGDHFFLNVAPFLVLVDYASWTSGPLLERQSFEKWLSVRRSLLVLQVAAFFVGPRKPYFVFDATKVIVGLIVTIRIGPRYLGHLPWSSSSGRQS